jgi:5-oxoprolinase (ATP-hydrolysing) subunit B
MDGCIVRHWDAPWATGHTVGAACDVYETQDRAVICALAKLRYRQTQIIGRTSIFPRFAPVGDSALSVEFDNEIEPHVNALVQALDRAIAASNVPGIIETVPSFRALLIVYEPEDIGLSTLVAQLKQLMHEGLNARPVLGRLWNVPVVYGYPDNDDLMEVSAAIGLSPAEIIEIHSGAEYQVYVVGFVPGLPVLGGLPAPLHLSRRPDPRPDLPAGRVMIGGMQGIIVPMPMPTGYYSLGQTPLRPYNRRAADPFLFRAGDRIRFRPIAATELDRFATVPGDYFLATDDRT